jgi:hypothetical protein
MTQLAWLPHNKFLVRHEELVGNTMKRQRGRTLVLAGASGWYGFRCHSPKRGIAILAFATKQLTLLHGQVG